MTTLFWFSLALCFPVSIAQGGGFFEVTMYTREFYSSFDDLFERFAIMTVDGRLSDENAILYLQAHTTIELYKKLKKTVAVLYKKKEKV